MNQSMYRIVLTVLTCCSYVNAAGDEYWNQFRGPQGNGLSTATELPISFGEDSREIIWKTPIPGRAWSSPVIWGRQVWLSNAPELQNPTDEKPKPDEPLKMSAVCIDLDSGRIVHDIVVFEVETPQYTHPTNSYASSTPVVEAGRIYLHYGVYGTACVDTQTAEILWKRNDLPCNHFRGPGSSLAVYGDLVYVTMDGYDEQYLAALDKRTGETVWKRNRDIDFGTDNGDAKKAFSTPTLITYQGQEMLISPFAIAASAYHPLTGETLWTVRHGGINAAARPLFGNGLVYIHASDGPKPLFAIRPEGAGDITNNIVWRTDKAVARRSSPLLIGDLLFMISDNGVASCLDALTGETLWTKRFGGDYWSSPLAANGLIYCTSQTGSIPVFKASREFELVAENKLDGGFNASPAVAGRSLILRSMTHLYRIETPDIKR